MPEKMIEAVRIGKEFTSNFKRLEVLKDISFSVKKGSFTSIVGMSGCGKTTLLKIICGISNPYSGQILIDGEGASKAGRNHYFGIVFQEPTLLPWRNVYNNIELPLELNSCPRTKFKADDLIKLVGLEGFENVMPHELSAGMKARVAIARALIFHPSILLMDEAFNNLDEITRSNLNLELLRIWEEIRTTVLFVTHNISEAIFLSDRIIVLTPRPGTVRKIIDVNLPRPRNKQTRRLPEFIEIVENARELLT